MPPSGIDIPSESNSPRSSWTCAKLTRFVISGLRGMLMKRKWNGLREISAKKPLRSSNSSAANPRPCKVSRRSCYAVA